jgi:phospholipase A1
MTIHAFNSNLSVQDALQYEQEGKYKEAMLIYKQLLLEQKTQESPQEPKQSTSTTSTIESNTSIGFEKLKTAFQKVHEEKTNETIEQILSSSFDLFPYKENYLLPLSYDFKQRHNRDQVEAKFQISVKKLITYDLLGLNETLYFGYTQKSYWQIYAHSSPFRETNYQPELYVFVPHEKNILPSLKAYKFGYLHESNGLGSENSRSWDRFYLEGYFQYDSLFIVPRVWLRIPENKQTDDNKDIEQYLGYGDINFLYAHKAHTFKLLVRNNFKLNEDNKGFVEFNWSFPLFGSDNTFGFVQLSSGYGDSLIDYDKEINRASFGISLTR